MITGQTSKNYLERPLSPIYAGFLAGMDAYGSIRSFCNSEPTIGGAMGIGSINDLFSSPTLRESDILLRSKGVTFNPVKAEIALMSSTGCALGLLVNAASLFTPQLFFSGMNYLNSVRQRIGAGEPVSSLDRILCKKR